MPPGQNRKQKQSCNKFNKDFKNGPYQKKFFFLKKENELDELTCCVLFVHILKLFHLFRGYFVYHSVLLLKEPFTLSVEETVCRAGVWGCSLWSQME